MCSAFDAETVDSVSISISATSKQMGEIKLVLMFNAVLSIQSIIVNKLLEKIFQCFSASIFS